MRRVYLFRHALPDFPNEEKYCIGSTDLPLSPLGHTQARLAAESFREIPFDRVFCSHLTRSWETALYFSPSPIVLEGLEELCAGEWDGLPFSVIRQRWPEVYEARGKNLHIPIPGAERLTDGQRRFLRALDQALSMSEGDVAVVSHKTIMQGFLCYVEDLSPEDGLRFPLNYCSCCVFTYDGDFHLESIIPGPTQENI